MTSRCECARQGHHVRGGQLMDRTGCSCWAQPCTCWDSCVSILLSAGIGRTSAACWLWHVTAMSRRSCQLSCQQCLRPDGLALLSAEISIVPGALAGACPLPPQLELMAELAVATAATTAEAEPEPELEALAADDACDVEQGGRHHMQRRIGFAAMAREPVPERWQALEEMPAGS